MPEPSTVTVEFTDDEMDDIDSALLMPDENARHKRLYVVLTKIVANRTVTSNKERARIWHEAFNVGLNEQARVDNGYEPITNPYDDQP